MRRTSLRVVTRTQGNNRDLKTGAVTPQSVDLDFVEVPRLVDAFRRMVRDEAYDVCELAVTTYLCAKEHGARFTALPVFLVRGFHDGAIQVRRGSGITEAEHLVGGRVGVNRGWTVTTGVWARSVLSEHHGVPLDRIEWILSGDEHVSAYVHPENVHPSTEGRDLERMLLADELAAVVGADIDHPDVVPLFPEAEDQAMWRFASDGVLPINHLVVVRDEVLRDAPELSVDLFDAFARSRQRYVSRLVSGSEKPSDSADRLYLKVIESNRSDSLLYGIAPNLASLEALMRHAREQNILRGRSSIESVFDTRTLELIG